MDGRTMTESWLFVQDETKQGEDVVLLTLPLTTPWAQLARVMTPDVQASM